MPCRNWARDVQFQRFWSLLSLLFLLTIVDPQTVNYFSESYVPGSWILMFSNSSIALCSGLFHPELQIPELILADHPANVDDQVRHKLVFLKAPVPPKYKLQSTSRCWRDYPSWHWHRRWVILCWGLGVGTVLSTYRIFAASQSFNHKIPVASFSLSYKNQKWLQTLPNKL
jgi:hypothetical protein